MRKFADVFSAFADSVEGLAGNNIFQKVADFFRHLAETIDPLPTTTPAGTVPDFTDLYGEEPNGSQITIAFSNWLIDDLSESYGSSFVGAFRDFTATLHVPLAFQQVNGVYRPNYAPGDPLFSNTSPPSTEDASETVMAATLQYVDTSAAAKTPFPLTPGLEDFHGVLM